MEQDKSFLNKLESIWEHPSHDTVVEQLYIVEMFCNYSALDVSLWLKRKSMVSKKSLSNMVNDIEWVLFGGRKDLRDRELLTMYFRTLLRDMKKVHYVPMYSDSYHAHLEDFIRLSEEKRKLAERIAWKEKQREKDRRRQEREKDRRRREEDRRRREKEKDRQKQEREKSGTISTMFGAKRKILAVLKDSPKKDFDPLLLSQVLNIDIEIVHKALDDLVHSGIIEAVD